jgi:two-component system, response regulator
MVKKPSNTSSERANTKTAVCVRDNPKLIILDLNLPKSDGLEILRRIRFNEGASMIPAVVPTLSLACKDRIESYKFGVNSCVVKPVGFDQFMGSGTTAIA